MEYALHFLPDSLHQNPRSDDGQSLLPHHYHDGEKNWVRYDRVSRPDGSRDKIRCLDGLRGIACFIVFNYHFLWPWTPLIMLGYGAWPPATLEPYEHWSQLPIICLLYRGRPMVALFFAISGYVVCRHILRSIHQQRIEAAYRSLASATFRRVFRLYIPATISMFIVAILAQTGTFKPERDIYKGPDSVYINGTVGTYSGTVDAHELTGNNGTIDPHGTSIYMSPMVSALGLNGAMGFNGSSVSITMTWNDTMPLNGTACNQCPWVRHGGMWEEHPIIHPNMTTALEAFATVYAEWANPFTFNPYYTRYDPHTYTMPMELRGSIILYVLLLGTAALEVGWRLAITAFLAVYSLRMGRWEVATFIGGMVLSEVDVLRSAEPDEVAESDRSFVPAGRRQPDRPPGWRARLLQYTLIAVSLYLLSYPDSNAAYTPGFRLLASLAPKYYTWSEKWRFYNSIGALILLPCILHNSPLRSLLETRPAQYLGRISFSLYLIHGPVLHSLGFWLMPRLFETVGRVQAFILGWVVMAVVSLALANVWSRHVDSRVVGVGKKIEQFMTRSR